MSYSYEDLYAGDLSRISEQFTQGTWNGTAAAKKDRPEGIPGQVSIVSVLSSGTPFKEKGAGFLSVYADSIDQRRRLLHRRGRNRLPSEPLAKFALAAEHLPPTGQAYGWYQEVIHYVPLSGIHVAKQIAKLCGDDSQVTIPYRSLSDAVGKTDRLGRDYAYMQRGVKALLESGWLTVETVGQKRGAKTTFYLQVGDTSEQAKRAVRDFWDPFSEDDFLEGE
ncbi:hypothetical protein OHA28_30750 [Streptomyces sp. NBC_00269]|uniref:hypothetical protein n=1 Tax=Streptomyces sp. NBC_00269 TaxID=2975696 RepID=UPI002E27AB2F|nr:hypothetical protein [Streptomyces sp. NBC_00269]